YVCVNKTESGAKRGVNNYNNNKVCNSGRYEKSCVEKYVINELSKIQHDKEYLEKMKNNSKKVDVSSLKKEIKSIDKKINRLNDLYVNDFISLSKLTEEIKKLNKLKEGYHKTIKLNYVENKNEDVISTLVNNIDISKSSYDVQSRIVKQLVDRVEVTTDNIDIIFNF
ncbi:TPA: recombinase family protein, partial [Streptococcus agalactiae]